jgi:hypothetical protein
MLSSSLQNGFVWHMASRRPAPQDSSQWVEAYVQDRAKSTEDFW